MIDRILWEVRAESSCATMDKTSETILSLRPVTFRYKPDTTGTSQFGLIAEVAGIDDPGHIV